MRHLGAGGLVRRFAVNPWKRTAVPGFLAPVLWFACLSCVRRTLPLVGLFLRATKLLMMLNRSLHWPGSIWVTGSWPMLALLVWTPLHALWRLRSCRFLCERYLRGSIEPFCVFAHDAASDEALQRAKRKAV